MASTQTLGRAWEGAPFLRSCAFTSLNIWESLLGNTYSVVQYVHLGLGTIDIWGRIVLCCEGLSCLVHCRMFSSIPGLYPLDASSALPLP